MQHRGPWHWMGWSLGALPACSSPILDAVQLPEPSTTAGVCEVHYEDPFQLRALQGGDTSHWLQPWKASVDTFPGTRVLDGLGITVTDLDAHPEWLSSTFELAHRAGLRLAIEELNWLHVSFADPTRFDADYLEPRLARIEAAADGGLRPIVLLNGRQPPARNGSITITERAAAGTRRLQIDASLAAGLVAGQSGFWQLPDTDARILFTAVSAEGALTLSKPLPLDLEPGEYSVRTWAVAPFRRPLDADGDIDPEYERTLDHWLSFVKTGIEVVYDRIGDNFDVEIYNELSPQAALFDVTDFYDEPPSQLGRSSTDAVVKDLVRRSVDVIRDPSLGLANVHIGNGFGNVRWAETLTDQMPGVDALDRHLSVKAVRFPPGYDEQSLPLRVGLTPELARSLDAAGQPNGGRAEDGTWQEAFTPEYLAFFPELPLTALGPLPLWRDLSPFPSIDPWGNTHARSATRQLWVSAFTLNLPSARALGVELSAPADIQHIKAKSALRAAVAYLGEGAHRLIFYQPDDIDVRIVDPDSPRVADALGRLVQAFADAQPLETIRPLSLLSIVDCPDSSQFAGDTATRPALSNSDALAFFPFQLSSSEHVVALYVMTRDLSHDYSAKSSSEPERFDLPDETYELTIGGVRGDEQVRLFDPLRDETASARILERGENRLTISVSLTDSPRLLELTPP